MLIFSSCSLEWKKDHASRLVLKCAWANQTLIAHIPESLSCTAFSFRNVESRFDLVSVSSPSPSGLLCLIVVFLLLASLNFLHKDWVTDRFRLDRIVHNRRIQQEPALPFPIYPVATQFRIVVELLKAVILAEYEICVSRTQNSTQEHRL